MFPNVYGDFNATNAYLPGVRISVGQVPDQISEDVGILIILISISKTYSKSKQIISPFKNLDLVEHL